MMEAETIGHEVRHGVRVVEVEAGKVPRGEPDVAGDGDDVRGGAADAHASAGQNLNDTLEECGLVAAAGPDEAESRGGTYHETKGRR